MDANNSKMVVLEIYENPVQADIAKSMLDTQVFTLHSMATTWRQSTPVSPSLCDSWYAIATTRMHAHYSILIAIKDFER